MKIFSKLLPYGVLVLVILAVLQTYVKTMVHKDFVVVDDVDGEVEGEIDGAVFEETEEEE